MPRSVLGFALALLALIAPAQLSADCSAGSMAGYAFGCDVTSNCGIYPPDSCYTTACLEDCNTQAPPVWAQMCADPGLPCYQIQFWMCNAYLCQYSGMFDQAKAITARWRNNWFRDAVEVQPATVLMKTTAYENGTAYKTLEAFRTWRADGSFADLTKTTLSGEQYGNSPPSVTGRIYNIDSGLQQIYNDDVGVIIPMVLSADEIETTRDMQRYCTYNMDKLGEAINGDKYHRRTRQDTGDRVIVREVKYDPTLGCTEVARRTYVEETGEVLYTAELVEKRPYTMEELFSTKPSYRQVSRVGYLDAYESHHGRPMVCKESEQAVRERSAELDRTTTFLMPTL